jgi:hypothetical protein
MGELKQGACHCGAVRFEAEVDLGSARRCDCSLCRMRGAVAVSAPLEGFTLLAGEDALRLYQFNTGTAKHYFCGTCGIYTHHQRRSNPDQYGVNVACLDGMSPFDFAEIEVLNGRAHPADTGVNRRSGMLRYTPD